MVEKQEDVYKRQVIVCGFLIVGSFLKVDLVWALTDMFNGLMVIPNLIALLALSGFVVKLNKEYESSNRLKPHKEEKNKKQRNRPMDELPQFVRTVQKPLWQDKLDIQATT